MHGQAGAGVAKLIKDVEKCQWACFSTSAKLGTELQEWTEWTILAAPFTFFALAILGNLSNIKKQKKQNKGGFLINVYFL